ncbi:oligosaccharide flippase family protein [Actinomycetospora sp. OC33-EN08]|uniref:Oligosaccharide flippase family protein n=1 Tax=Actinomycetospora aurantiaca TaxID=3129233 RepID=A0ABU8MGF0_9PSEU
MATRLVFGIVISGLGLLVVARLIGPEAYGTYGTAFAIWFTLQNLTELNLDVWLVRRGTSDDDMGAARVALTAILGLSSLGALALYLAAPAIADLANIPDLEGTLRYLAPLLLITGIGQPALSLLERRLDFKSVGLIEMLCQGLFYVVAVILATMSFGLTSLIVALAVQQSALTLIFVLKVPNAAMPLWDKKIAKEAFRFGFAATLSSVVENGRSLVLQVLVARYGGASAAGYYSLCIRLLEQASFAKQVLYRLSTAVFGRLRDDTGRLARSLDKAVVAQLLALAPPLLLLAWVGPHLLPLLFGAEWTPVAELLPVLIPTYLVLSLSRLHQSALLALDKTLPVFWMTLGYLVVLAIGAAPSIVSFGTYGVAVAEGFASIALAAGVVLFWRILPLPSLLITTLLLAAISLAAQASIFGPLISLVVALPFISRRLRQVTGELVSGLRTGTKRLEG